LHTGSSKNSALVVSKLQYSQTLFGWQLGFSVGHSCTDYWGIITKYGQFGHHLIPDSQRPVQNCKKWLQSWSVYSTLLCIIV